MKLPDVFSSVCLAVAPWLADWTFWTMISTAVYTVFTFLLWKVAGIHFRHARTSTYIERYNSAEFTTLRAEVDQFLYLTEKLEPSERGKVYRELLFSDHLEDMEFRHKLWTFTMLFNEIGLAWQGKVIDQEAIGNFDRLIPRYWMRLRPYIMNLHLRFGFEVPIDEQGFKSEFKLFKSFRFAYLEVIRVKIGILPEDLETSSLLCRDNFAPLEYAMVHGRPATPQRLGVNDSVIRSVRTTGKV